jgi:hypothetical protein
MLSRLPIWLISAALLGLVPLHGHERNGWPLFVQQEKADGSVESAEYLGPLFFNHHIPGEPHQAGFRPVYMKSRDGDVETSYLLYPFFTWRRETDYRSFSFFQLVNTSRETDARQPTIHTFDVWPFYFSRDTGQPETTYHALFPIGGTIKERLGYDRLHFVLFPLYAEADQKGARTTHAPWPFLRFISGGGNHGFEFWPLFGHRGRAHDYDSQFYLWPLIYKSTSNLSEPQPDIKLGVLPFYARVTAPGYIDETYLWPFFGYSHRTDPLKYDEQRYFWPFFVQGRGDVSYVNRWGPFYTHSVVKGYDKTWFAWPVFRHARWEDGGIAQEQNQVLFFLYWSLTQRSTTNPRAAPAHKTHLWPLFSSWDNGAGRRQLQILSPFEVFFPTNEPVRQLYSPLFAVYRYDQRAPDDIRRSVLFSLLSWKRSPAEREFHFGPFFSTHWTPERARVVLGQGLFAWQRRPDTGPWIFSLFDFSPRKDNKATAALSP